MTQKFPPSLAEWLEKHSLIKDIERNVLGCGKQNNGHVLEIMLPDMAKGFLQM